MAIELTEENYKGALGVGTALVVQGDKLILGLVVSTGPVKDSGTSGLKQEVSISEDPIEKRRLVINLKSQVLSGKVYPQEATPTPENVSYSVINCGTGASLVTQTLSLDALALSLLKQYPSVQIMEKDEYAMGEHGYIISWGKNDVGNSTEDALSHTTTTTQAPEESEAEPGNTTDRTTVSW